MAGFDVRPSGASFTGETIERVNIHTGEVEVIYRATQQAHVGVVTVHPKSEKYVFIHGPENPDETWHYDFHHRRGVIAGQGDVTNLDAMDITVPFTHGALRGGSHVHVLARTASLSASPITTMCCVSVPRRWIYVTLAWLRRTVR